MEHTFRYIQITYCYVHTCNIIMYCMLCILLFSLLWIEWKMPHVNPADFAQHQHSNWNTTCIVHMKHAVAAHTVIISTPCTYSSQMGSVCLSVYRYLHVPTLWLKVSRYVYLNYRASWLYVIQLDWYHRNDKHRPTFNPVIRNDDNDDNHQVSQSASQPAAK